MGFLSKLFEEKKKVQPVSVNDENFRQEVLESELPVMLDVWGPSCAHCTRLEPIILRLAAKYEGKVKVAEMNAGSAPMTSGSLGVRGTPTVIYFKDGKIIERVSGFRGELYHMEIIETEFLGHGDGEDQA
ncbi:MAG: thioredoxin domain-containing protein [Pseudomonadota bacterium]